MDPAKKKIKNNIFSTFFVKCKVNIIDYTSIFEPERLIIFNSLFITRRKNSNLRKSLAKRMNTYLTKKKPTQKTITMINVFIFNK